MNLLALFSSDIRVSTISGPTVLNLLTYKEVYQVIFDKTNSTVNADESITDINQMCVLVCKHLKYSAVFFFAFLVEKLSKGNYKVEHLYSFFKTKSITFGDIPLLTMFN